MIDGHGDDVNIELNANFSSNVWYGANNKALYHHLSSTMHTISRYPETNPTHLKQLISHEIGVDASQLIVCNGSTEAFYLIATAFATKKSLIVTPTFSEYADACRMHRHAVFQTSRSCFKNDIITLQPDLVWLCNPNNPDGYALTAAELIETIKLHPTIYFIVDQAYIDYSMVQTDVIPYMDSCKNIIVVQSLTKRYAIPGLRLGYIVANNDILSKIEKVRIPWSVNSLAIEAGKYILKTKTNDYDLKNWLQDTAKLKMAINEIPILEVIPSTTPYFLIKLKKGLANDLKSFLLNDKILIRDATNFVEHSQELIRICTLSSDMNKLLIEKLYQWSQHISSL